MRIFLTGGTGYIGFALARRLVASGHEVYPCPKPAPPHPGAGSDRGRVD